jgi:iron complex outermembrane receptor protein
MFMATHGQSGGNMGTKRDWSGSLRRIAVICSLALGGLGGPALAAPLDEIVVTATKRVESAQDIPISLTAFDAKSIRELGFRQSFDVAAQTPNLQFMAEASNSIPFIFLRGIGNTSFFPNSINPVGVYADSVYLGQSVTQGFQLFDLERIEVLRGPQGTLFGRNTTAGLINFISQKPSVADGLNGRGEVTVGDFGQFDVEGALGFPMGDKFAARLAVLQRTSDGMYDNVNPAVGGDFGEVDALSFRGQLLWQPTDNFSGLLRISYFDDDSDISSYKPGYIESPFGVPNCPPGAVSGALNNGCSDPFGFGLTVVPNLQDNQSSFDSRQHLETTGVSAEINWEFGDYMLTSISSYHDADMTRFEDDDSNTLTIIHDTFLVDADFVSQELRLTSNLAGPMNWLVGLYYYSDDLHSNIFFNSLDLGPPPDLGVPVPIYLGQDVRQKTDTYAVFGDISYVFAERWTASLGLRYTKDERDVDVNAFIGDATMVPNLVPISKAQAQAAALFPTIPPTKVDDDWTKLSGNVSLEYAFNDNQMVYVSAARGFKGGEFNGGALIDVAEATVTDPETLDSYELGYKGLLLDQALQFNITGFYMEYDDQQVLISATTPAGILPSLQNAASSEIKGVEWDIKWQPTDELYFSFGGAYLDAELDNFFDPVLGVDRSGNDQAHAPEWNFNGVIRYSAKLFGRTASAQVDGDWRDSQYFTVENDQALKEGSYGLVNTRLGYRFLDEKAEAAIFVRNIFDENYIATGFDANKANFGANQFVVGTPRTYGVQLSYEF